MKNPEQDQKEIVKTERYSIPNGKQGMGQENIGMGKHWNGRMTETSETSEMLEMLETDLVEYGI